MFISVSIKLFQKQFTLGNDHILNIFSSLPTHSSCTFISNVLIKCFLLLFLGLRSFLVTCFLIRLDCFSFVFGSFDSLVTLCLTNLWFHVSLGQYSFQTCTLNSSLKFHCSSCSFLCNFLLGAFLVFLTV